MRISGIRNRHVHFGFSPARETLRSIEVLLHPAHHAEQMPWIRVARRRLRRELRAELQHFGFFFNSTVELFPALWDEPQTLDVQSEIAALRANKVVYSEAVVRRLRGASLLEKSALRQMLKPQWYRHAAAEYAAREPKAEPMLNEFIASPSRSLERFCTMLGMMHDEIVQPVWGAVESGLSQDIAMRRRVLRKHGLTALLRTLSHGLLVRQGLIGSSDLECGPADGEIVFDESSRLELSPSFFCWPHLQTFVMKQPHGTRCTITYPVPPLPAYVTPLNDRRTLAARAAVLGDETRLRILELLRGRDLSTRELSGFLRMAAPSISRHLQALLRERLVERYRSGYFVMYRLNREALAKTAAAIVALA